MGRFFFGGNFGAWREDYSKSMMMMMMMMMMTTTWMRMSRQRFEKGVSDYLCLNLVRVYRRDGCDVVSSASAS